jgi:hypothetical protein
MVHPEVIGAGDKTNIVWLIEVDVRCRVYVRVISHGSPQKYECMISAGISTSRL